MSDSISRRDFLKLGSVAAAGLVLPPDPFPVEQEAVWETNSWGRIANAQVSVYSRPEDNSRILKQIYRDTVFRIYKAVTPPTGPAWNPIWYRIWGGYVHSANVQVVSTQHNPTVETFPENGRLGTITVPYTQTMRNSRFDGWTNLYRLYFQTTHWVTGLTTGPDNTPWYELTDEAGGTIFYAPAHHIRLIPDEELAPISPEVAWEDKRIEVDVNRQTMTAYEANNVVLHTKVSTGIKTNSTNGIPTLTPLGTFNIASKMPSKHMGEGRLTDNLEDYELLGVPWTAFFDWERGYAIHGTFWHNNFGVQMSRGCINMKNSEAQWLFRWMTPHNSPDAINTNGFGTRLDIF